MDPKNNDRLDEGYLLLTKISFVLYNVKTAKNHLETINDRTYAKDKENIPS